MRFFRRILRSRAIILVPLVVAAIFAILYFFEQSTREVAKQFAAQLETAPEEDVNEILDRLGRLGKAGIPELVHALASNRRVVVLGSKNTLEREFRNWKQLDNRQFAQFHSILAQTLLEDLDRLGPTSRLAAASFAQRTLQTLLAAPAERKISGRLDITKACEEILRKTEGERIVAGNPKRLNEMYTIAGSGEPVRVYPPDPFEQELILAANERNRPISMPRSPVKSERREEMPEFYDPYSSPRAELLYAVHRSRLDSAVKEPPLPANLYDRPLDAAQIERLSGLERLAFENAKRNLQGAEEDFLQPDSLHRAQVAERIASQYSPQIGVPQPESEERLPQLPAYEAAPLKVIPDTTPVYPEEPVENTMLGKTALEEIPNLPTPDLIRLLQHPDRSIKAVAEKRLRDRDRFQDEHIALAYRLHHPNVEIRKGMIDALIRTPSVQPISWIMEMLRDNDSDVRLAAITFIATSKDKSLLQDVLQRARKDEDPKINALIEKLERIQRF